MLPPLGRYPQISVRLPEALAIIFRGSGAVTASFARLYDRLVPAASPCFDIGTEGSERDRCLDDATLTIATGLGSQHKFYELTTQQCYLMSP